MRLLLTILTCWGLGGLAMAAECQRAADLQRLVPGGLHAKERQVRRPQGMTSTLAHLVAAFAAERYEADGVELIEEKRFAFERGVLVEQPSAWRLRRDASEISVASDSARVWSAADELGVLARPEAAEEAAAASLRVAGFAAERISAVLECLQQLAAKVRFGYDAMAQNGCAAPTTHLLVIDPERETVAGVDLFPCRE